MTELLYLEDFTVGETYNLGSHTVTAGEIWHYAQQWDPQPFHLMSEQDQAGPFGGLVASGWHTAAIFMRLYTDEILTKSASAGSPGIDDLRWKEPVRPGDTLTGKLVIEAIIPSMTDATKGIIKPQCALTNQHDQIVLNMYLYSLFTRRPVPDEARH